MGKMLGSCEAGKLKGGEIEVEKVGKDRS